MKSLSLFLFIVICILGFSSCASKTPVLSKDEQIITMPCVDESYDDDSFFKALGTAQSTVLSKARNTAFDDAQSMIRRRLNGLVTKVSEDYTEYIDAKSNNSEIEKTLSTIANSAVKTVINNALKTCEKSLVDKFGRYNVFIAVKVSKEKVIEKFGNGIENNEELKTKFNREQLRNYAQKQLENL